MRDTKQIWKWFSILLIQGVVLFSCSSKGSHEFTTSINEAGVGICVNSGGPRYSEPLYDIDETLSLGGEEPVPTLYQPQPWSFLVDHEGCLYFTDEDRIKKFDEAGQFERYIGAKGEGPGEVSYPRLHRIIGDTLVVEQTRKTGGSGERYDLFNLNGLFINRMMIPKPRIKLLEEGWNSVREYMGNGTYLFTTYKDWEHGELSVTQHAYGLSDRKGDFIRQLDITIEPKPTGIIKKGDDYITTTMIPYTVGCIIEVHQNICCLMPSGKELRLFTFVGELVRIIQLDLPESPVTQYDRDKLMKRWNRPGRHSSLTNRDFPTTKPVAGGILMDDLGNFWLMKGDEIYNYGKEPVTYMVIDKNGEYIGDQTLPMNLTVVKHGYAYGFFVTEDELQIFKRYKLKRK
jgi:hypothetical protein